MAKTIKSRMVYGKLLEIVESSYGWYQLYFDGELKQQSPNLNHIVSQFDRF